MEPTTPLQPIKRQLYAPATVCLRANGEGENTESRTIEGYAILFNTPSAPLWEDEDEVAREQISPEAITRDLLDGCDIKMTMNHNFDQLLARSKQGQGTLQYEIDERGVKFSFEAPHTADGDKAIELVRRRDIDGCSFMFTCSYYDKNCVERKVTKNAETGKAEIMYTIRAITGIYDFTLTPMPAYPDTEVDVRSLLQPRVAQPEARMTDEAKAMTEVSEMRDMAAKQI